jgi:hypothetical protein
MSTALMGALYEKEVICQSYLSLFFNAGTGRNVPSGQCSPLLSQRWLTLQGRLGPVDEAEVSRYRRPSSWGGSDRRPEREGRRGQHSDTGERRGEKETGMIQGAEGQCKGGERSAKVRARV